MIGLLLFLVIINLLVTMGIAGTLVRVLNHLTVIEEEEEDIATINHTQRGLVDLPERQVTYRDTFMMQQNWDGVTPRPKNFDGVPQPEE